MSAWLVEKEHIDLMVRYARGTKLVWKAEDEWREVMQVMPDDLGRMLYEENVASLCYRYESDTAEMYEEALGYEFTDPGYTLTDAEALKAIECFEYQACEHSGWEESEAASLCRSMFHAAASRLMAGPWGWDSDELAKRAKSQPVFGV